MSQAGRLTVADLLREESLKLRLVAGAPGTSAEVKGVHISEIPDPTPWLSPGDVLLTTGISVRDDIELQKELVRRLARAGVAALGLAEGIYLDRTDPQVRSEADRLRLPLFEVPLDVPFKSITSLVFNSLHSASFYQLRRSLSVQDRLLALLLEDRGLDHLVSSVAILLSTSVIVFDSLGQAVSQAHARTRVTPHLRELVWNVYLAEGCRREPGVAGLEIGPHRVFLEEICLAGRTEQILCFIYPRGEGVTEMARIIMEYARKILSLELHRSREEVLVRTRMRAGLLDDLLSGVGSRESLADRLANFRFSRSAPSVLLVCDVDRFTERVDEGRDLAAEERLQQLKSYFKDSVDSFFSARRLPSISLTKSDSIVVLLQPASSEKTDLRALGHGLRDHVAENPPHLGTTVGMSDPFTDVADGARSLAQAREAVEGGRLQEGARVVLFSDLGPRLRALENHPPEWLESLAAQALGPVLTRGDERDHLLDSLRHYLESNRNVMRAAQRLYVHPNTLRNRLRKVEELLDRPLEDTATLVDLSLAFEALRILARRGEALDSLTLPPGGGGRPAAAGGGP